MEQPNIKHLEFIQSVITRMNTNSFHIKGWTITIVAALFAVFVSTKNELFVLVGLFPVAVFWFLDAFYLMQERKFRGLYDDVAGISDNPQQIKEFEMSPDKYIKGKYSFLNVLFSKSIILLYAPLFLIIVIVFFCIDSCF